MERECPACDGSGVCKNGVHDRDALWRVVNDGLECKGCGNSPNHPGDCGRCNGSGVIDDGEMP